MYLPDAIAAFQSDGSTFLITANEGDTRDYDGYSEEERIGDVELDPSAFPNAEALQADDVLGRLKITSSRGDIDGDGDYDKLYSFGARSFSIWDSSGKLVYDSGDDLEQITAEMLPDEFNSTNEENGSFDNRSDDKGPEPEGIQIAVMADKTYAFVGMERIGGVAAFDITNARAPEFVTYANNRDFSGDPEDNSAGDLGPEGLVFIPVSRSPIKNSLLVTMNEISGTTTIYRIVKTQ